MTWPLPLPFFLGGILGSLIVDWITGQKHGPHNLIIPFIITVILLILRG